MIDMTGKVAVVTGCASGIGKDLVGLLIQQGASVVGVDLTEAPLYEMEKEYEGKFVAYPGSVALQKVNEGMIDKAIEKFGKIDMLFNNAGVIDDYMSVKTVTNEMWDKNYNVNVKGPMFAMRYFVQKKTELGEKGVIVSSASVCGAAHPTVAGAAYASSKAALIQLTRHTAYSFGDKGIRCNAICIGAAPNTTISKTYVNPDPDGMNKMMASCGTLIQMADAVELSHALLWLASDEASYCNGAILNVDGAWSCS